MTIRWKELVFPALAGVWILLYWLQLDGAPRAARVVPVGTIILLGVLAAVIVVRDGIFSKDRAIDAPAQTEINPDASRSLWRYWREAAYVLLSVLYFLIFAYIGFHVANVVFLALALWISGNKPRTIVVATAITAAVIFAAAHLMQFSLPTPIFFR